MKRRPPPFPQAVPPSGAFLRLWVFYETLARLKKYATLLPKKLANRDPGDACVEEAWQTVGGKGADF
ncbi:hypothetical protein RCO48_23525 [Peribacillus frigoritolerans]|nr:hypothetical protein [Peribacillus frigoritolerans]